MAPTTSVSQPQAKCWVFTLFYDGVYEDGTPRPTRDEALALIDKVVERGNYCVWGDEVCPTTGSKHFQCYAQFPDRVRRGALTALVPRTNWEVARGSDQDNFVYCTKDGKFEEAGERRDTTGGRAGRDAEQLRWRLAREAAMTGDLGMVDDQLFVQHYAALKHIQKDYMKMPPDAPNTTGIWIYGPPGTGKSRKARADYPGAYLKLCNKWWDGYNPNVHKAVIMDDLDKNHHVLCYHIKIWADRYAFMAETKGGAIAIRPDPIVVTSNYSIEDVFGPDEAAVLAIKRRFKVIHMDRPFSALTDRAQTHADSSSTRARLITPEPSISSTTESQLPNPTENVPTELATVPLTRQSNIGVASRFSQAPTQILGEEEDDVVDLTQF